MNLLTENNQKVLKGEDAGYFTVILHLAPSTLSGYQTCPMATLGCAIACLNTAGHGGMFKKGEATNKVQEARKRRTVMFFEQRREFMALLVKDIRSAIRKAAKRGMKLAIRLNGTSDIRWETVAVGGYENIMAMFPFVQFYDYQKRTRLSSDIPSNYHLTFSRAESNESTALDMLAKGQNVAVVFSSKKNDDLPNEWKGYKVIDGDENDLRFLDPKNVVVGLRAKGRAKKDTTGFVVHV